MALGVLAAMLPARWWPWLDVYVRASGGALAAAVVTILAAGAIGIPGFLNYLAYVADAHNSAAWELAKQNPGAVDDNPGGILRGAPTAMTALALPMFLFTTPLGLLTLYLSVSGLLRVAAALVDDAFGDPILTGIDKLVVGTHRRRRARAARVHRESLEGPEMPDRIISAAQLDIPNADFVIVASRRKPDWDKGTIVQTEDGTSYRVGEIQERTLAGRLRTLYPLTEHTDLEVFRRVVRYELPPGRQK
jgi:hypothetical protein